MFQPTNDKTESVREGEYNGSTDSFEKDIAATIVPEQAQDIDPEIERRVLRKVDLWLIPWMWIGYGFVYYDKVCKCDPQKFDSFH